MNSFFKLILISIFTLSVCACNSTQKPETKSSDSLNAVTVTDGWVRPAAKRANSAAYLTIYNGTASTDTLLNVTSDAAKMAGLHETYKNEKGMMGMRHAGPVAIQPDSNLVLEPGGFHIMLMNLNRKLAKGDSLQLSLEFAVSGKKTITIPVQSVL